MTPAMNTKNAVETLVHYIKLACEKAGDELSPDCKQELYEAVLAFDELDRRVSSNLPE